MELNEDEKLAFEMRKTQLAEKTNSQCQENGADDVASNVLTIERKFQRLDARLHKIKTSIDFDNLTLESKASIDNVLHEIACCERTIARTEALIKDYAGTEHHAELQGKTDQCSLYRFLLYNQLTYRSTHELKKKHNDGFEIYTPNATKEKVDDCFVVNEGYDQQFEIDENKVAEKLAFNDRTMNNMMSELSSINKQSLKKVLSVLDNLDDTVAVLKNAIDLAQMGKNVGSSIAQLEDKLSEAIGFRLFVLDSLDQMKKDHRRPHNAAHKPNGSIPPPMVVYARMPSVSNTCLHYQDASEFNNNASAKIHFQNEPMEPAENVDVDPQLMCKSVHALSCEMVKRNMISKANDPFLVVDVVNGKCENADSSVHVYTVLYNGASLRTLSKRMWEYMNLPIDKWSDDSISFFAISQWRYKDSRVFVDPKKIPINSYLSFGFGKAEAFFCETNRSFRRHINVLPNFDCVDTQYTLAATINHEPYSQSNPFKDCLKIELNSNH